MEKTALFIHRPRRWADLLFPHSLEQERPYQVTATVILSSVDYENFSEDLLADREFLRVCGDPCGGGRDFRCILVRTRTGSDGILVCPRGPFVQRAAALLL